jgi:hypothetical protein
LLSRGAHNPWKENISSVLITDSLPGKYSAILGIDFAKKHGLSYCSISNSTYFEKPEKVLSAAILSKNVYLPARSSTKVKLKMPFESLQTTLQTFCW